jgi:predicted transposase YdaD
MQFDTTVKGLLGKRLKPRIVADNPRIDPPHPRQSAASAYIRGSFCAALPGKAARNELAKLMVLSKLRGLQKIVVEEAKKAMELTVEDLMDIPFVEEAFLKGEKEGEEKGKKEGKKEGQAEMLSHMLEGRFGPLPEWAREKIASAEIETLEKWGLRLLDASNLEEVLAENIH